MFSVLDIIEVSLSFSFLPDDRICFRVNSFLFNTIILQTERKVDLIIPTLNLHLRLEVWLLGVSNFHLYLVLGIVLGNIKKSLTGKGVLIFQLLFKFPFVDHRVPCLTLSRSFSVHPGTGQNFSTSQETGYIWCGSFPVNTASRILDFVSRIFDSGL